MEIDEVTGGIIGDAIAVHRELGPGLLESAYEACLSSLLVQRGLLVERQFTLPVVFRNQPMDCVYRLDMLVEKRVVVELKAVAQFDPIHMAQMITYLKLSGCEVGLMINFNVVRLKDGIPCNYKPKYISHPSAPSAVDSR